MLPQLALVLQSERVRRRRQHLEQTTPLWGRARQRGELEEPACGALPDPTLLLQVPHTKQTASAAQIFTMLLQQGRRATPTHVRTIWRSLATAPMPSSRCPIAHGSPGAAGDPATGGRPRQWWPNALNLKILHPSTGADPSQGTFNYVRSQEIFMDAVPALACAARHPRAPSVYPDGRPGRGKGA